MLYQERLQENDRAADHGLTLDCAILARQNKIV